MITLSHIIFWVFPKIFQNSYFLKLWATDLDFTRNYRYVFVFLAQVHLRLKFCTCFLAFFDEKSFHVTEITKYWFWSLCLLFFIKFLFFHQMIALKELWKMFFISFSLQKLFPFLTYSNFCNFFPSFPNFPDSRGQMEVE